MIIEQLPDENLVPAYYKVGFRFRAEDFQGMSRSLFVKSLRAEGIAFDVGFRGLHLIHASRRFRTAGELTQASRADEEMLTLHHPVLIHGDEAIDEVAAAIERVRTWSEEIQSNRSTIENCGADQTQLQ